MKVWIFLLFIGCPAINAQGAGGWGGNVPVDSGIFSEANSSFFGPFVNPSMRFQQVYGASAFPRIATNTGLGFVERIFFRTDTPTGFEFSGIASNLEIRLSTTTKGPDSLSPVFAENVGVDEVVVLGPADFFVFGAHVPSENSAQEYSLRIDFATPFLYRPADGNLLVDFRVNGGAAGILDAWNRVGDSVGSVFGSLNDNFGQPSTLGLATHFEGTLAVPEPSAWVFMALTASAALLFHPRRK